MSTYLLVDQGSQLRSEDFKETTQQSGITLRHTGLEAHNSLGLLERYHDAIRRTFDKIVLDEPLIRPAMALSAAVKAANDCTGPNGIFPTTLVFGVYPAIDSQVPPTQQNRDGVLRKAHITMQQIFASRKVKEALRARVPSGVDEVYIPGELVLVFREKEKRWTGQYSVHNATDRLITVVNDHEQLVTHAIPQVKPYLPGYVHFMARSLAYPTFDGDRSTMHDDEPALATEDLSETALETMQAHDPAGIASNFVRKTMGAIKLHTPHTRVHCEGAQAVLVSTVIKWFKRWENGLVWRHPITG
jgi:hypothetical protein